MVQMPGAAGRGAMLLAVFAYDRSIRRRLPGSYMINISITCNESFMQANEGCEFIWAVLSSMLNC